MPNLLHLFCRLIVAAFCVLSIVAAVYAADEPEDPISACGADCFIAAKASNQGDPR